MRSMATLYSISPDFIHFVNGSLINNLDAGLLVPVRDI